MRVNMQFTRTSDWEHAMSEQQDPGTPYPAVSALSNDELRDTIARMFNNWCWISGDPEEKRYYELLLAEAERRKGSRSSS